MTESIATIAKGNVGPMTTGPAKIGDYQLVALLGSGGMGDVYFGVSPTADPVAVKVIRPHLVTGHMVRERFASEVDSLKMVFGSRVARLEDADPYGDPAWLAVEYVPGLTLKQHVEVHGPLQPELAAMIGAMLADGLVKVHQAGLLHRDLKPQNVILGPDGPKLIDFGLAVLTEREHELTETGMAVGTPAYMAPEQARGDKELTAAVDIYGLGATLAYALTGHALYPGTKQHILLQRVADPADLPDLTDLPREMAPLLGAMLAFDPSARPGLGAVRTRLLEVAVSGGASIGQMRDKVVQATYDSSAKLEVPPPLTDPVEDPEDTERGEGLSVFTPEESSSEVDEPPTTERPAVDVTWLIENLRQQYARRKTL